MLLCEELTGKGKELVRGLLKCSFKRSWWEMGCLDGNLIKALQATATDENFGKG